jgi:Kef-type K+ transport system membrane component KefB
MAKSARTEITFPRVWRDVREHVAAYGFAVGGPLLLAATACYLGTRYFGATTVSTEIEVGTEAKPLFNLLIALVAILVACRICGAFFVRLGQPKVLGEVVAGIALGPSLLGAIAPGAAAALFPEATLPLLQSIGELGLILFMFLVGVEFDFTLIRRKAHVALLVSHTSISWPFLGGVALGLFIYPTYYRGSVQFLPFTLFMGLAMSVTAFPVLTRILRDRNLQSTHLGVMALACAAADDVTAWSLLAVVLGIANAHIVAGFGTLAAALAYCAFMWTVVRPVLHHLTAKQDQATLPVLLIGLLASAAVTEWIGIHAFFGAFLFGLCIPRDANVTKLLSGKLEDLTAWVLMPAFFVTSGMRTQFGLLQSWDGWLICLLVVVVATAGKLIGAVVPARMAGLPWRDSFALGALMNTRGLMEIVIANIGLECGIIPPQMFTVLIIMALVTSAAAGPVLNITMADHSRLRESDRRREFELAHR